MRTGVLQARSALTTQAASGDGDAGGISPVKNASSGGGSDEIIGLVRETMRKRKHNPKREIRKIVDPILSGALLAKIKYVGSPFHKSRRGKFGLVPPVQPRPDKTLCDAVDISEPRAARDLLKRGVEAGLISVQQRGEFPQNIWAVSSEGVALEAQLDNAEQGTYHGYPMGFGDPLAKRVVERWHERFKS